MATGIFQCLTPTDREYGLVRIPFPKRLEGQRIKEVRIQPKYNARFFDVEYIIEAEPTPANVDIEKALAVDLGLNNLAACVDTDGASFLVDGLWLKSINQ